MLADCGRRNTTICWRSTSCINVGMLSPCLPLKLKAVSSFIVTSKMLKIATSWYREVNYKALEQKWLHCTTNCFNLMPRMNSFLFLLCKLFALNYHYFLEIYGKCFHVGSVYALMISLAQMFSSLLHPTVDIHDVCCLLFPAPPFPLCTASAPLLIWPSPSGANCEGQGQAAGECSCSVAKGQVWTSACWCSDMTSARWLDVIAILNGDVPFRQTVTARYIVILSKRMPLLFFPR